MPLDSSGLIRHILGNVIINPNSELCEKADGNKARGCLQTRAISCKYRLPGECVSALDRPTPRYPPARLPGNGQNRASFPRCACSQTCKPASCNISLRIPASCFKEPAATSFLFAQQAAFLSLQHLLFPLSKPTTTSSNPSCASSQSIPASTNTMAARTLEAGFQRMSIQDENAQGESGRVYQKTSKVKQPTQFQTHLNRADCSDNRLFVNTARIVHKSLEPLQGRPPVAEHKHRRDRDASLSGRPA